VSASLRPGRHVATWPTAASCAGRRPPAAGGTLCHFLGGSASSPHTLIRERGAEFADVSMVGVSDRGRPTP